MSCMRPGSAQALHLSDRRGSQDFGRTTTGNRAQSDNHFRVFRDTPESAAIAASAKPIRGKELTDERGCESANETRCAFGKLPG